VLDELDGFEILSTAITVRYPFSVLTRIIEIEHGSNSIDPQTVDMILIEPEQGTANKKITHLLAAVIVDQRTPFGVGSLAGVLMLIKRGTVEIGKTVGIFWKMGRHPVKQDANLILMADIDEIHKIVGNTVSACHTEGTCNLVAP